ncbi:DUF1566 domain-containing protein [bacterium]|nr:DUF1566 domain-containing protein [bacterium]
MKKLILLLIALIFLAVSCGGSKNTETDADTDILPDEDAPDDDKDEPGETGDKDDSPDEDATATATPCDQCKDFANTDGTCINKEDGTFECGCLEGYFWGHLGCKKLTFANICTGQNKCYYGDYYDTSAMQKCPAEESVIYGQDYQYAQLGFCAPRRFHHNDDGTVTDKNMEIEWTEEASASTFVWSKAEEYCENLKLGGHNDWRLPSPKELLGENNSKDYDVSFWSAVSPGEETSMVWIMTKTHTLQKRSKDSYAGIHCVRGDSEGVPELRSIEINSSTIIEDTGSGTLWQKNFSKGYRWSEALSFCERSTFAGFSDWRLPNIHELTSLIDHQSEAVSDFQTPEDILEVNSLFWSSTTNSYNTSSPHAYTVDFKTGELSSLEKDSNVVKARALCIRNDPCKEGFWWNGEKCARNPCEEDPCKDTEHSDGTCGTDDFKSYYCGCDENYFWDGGQCAKNPCSPDPCGDYGHTTGECSAPNSFTFICSCDEGYWWWGKEKGCMKDRPHQARVCTGQTKCYDNEKEIECPAEGEDFYGQDAQYAALGSCAPQNLVMDYYYENEPIVIDKNTGLEWQQKVMPADNISWYDVQNYCDKLDYGGYHDWRLPTFYELQTLISYNSSPTTEAKYFPDTPPENFWSSTITQYGSYDSAYVVNFEDADLGEMMLSDFITGETNRLMSSIRCVRGEFFEENRGSVLAVSYEEEILYTNSTTDLIWTIFTPEYYYETNTWQERMKYCEDLDFAGFSDWRLPNIHELNSISLDGRWLRYGSSSTTMPWHPAEHFADGSYKDDRDNFYLCVRENPCDDDKLWDHGKCVDTVCVPNPCEDEEKNSSGGCLMDSGSETGFYCTCDDGYVWDAAKIKCVFKTDRCDPNPCLEVENSTGECLQPGPYEQKCVCAEGYHWKGWDGTCIED